mmetsp:Transcript_20800/g.49390  ORF Transcript_20800/g.49390 Transcript_20800/m.49390 type:complete len:545 (-) Transcript_20800:328-1962(-)
MEDKSNNIVKPLSPPSSPSRVRLSVSSDGGGEGSAKILRSSLQLSPSWDKQCQSLRHLGDLDDDDMVNVAFFPTMPPPPSIPDLYPVSGGGGAAPAAIVIPTGKGGTPTKKEDVNRTESDDNWSAASLTDSIFSAFSSGGIWEDVPAAAPDAILGIAAAFRACDNPNKVNVCVGAYRDENGRPYVLPTVRKAEYRMLEQDENHEYLSIEGDREFIDCAMKFAYGTDQGFLDRHLAAVQTLSGTGACSIGGRFLAQFWPDHPVYVPDPTWGNHHAIFKACGMKVRKYRYYDRSKNKLDLEGMMEDLHRANDGSIILLHACAHNPTGCDPTFEEWKEIISLISSKGHVAFFDSAYQGFASGSAEDDAQAFRYAVSQHVPILLAQSFAKNFGMYGERVGSLSIVCGDIVQKERIMSELRTIIRPLYSSPPRHGSSIVKIVLSDPGLKEEYYQECANMAVRIKKMRKKLVNALAQAGSKHDWSHIVQQIGMFAFTGMDKEMCQRLTDEYYIFLTLNGRISMAGLNESNISYVANAIHDVTDGKSISGP